MSIAFENPGTASNQEISDWLDKSLSINENVANLYMKARLLERLGKKAEAIKTGEQAIAAARPDQKNFADTVRQNVERWKR